MMNSRFFPQYTLVESYTCRSDNWKDFVYLTRGYRKKEAEKFVENIRVTDFSYSSIRQIAMNPDVLF